MLWDRTDPNGYARHITNDPLPGTPPHYVMLHEALGDHQVDNLATQVEARTIGASVHTPTVEPGPQLRGGSVLRHPGDRELSVLRLGDHPLRQRRRRAADHQHGAADASFDPHSDPRRSVIARQQKSDFLQTGGFVTDVCPGVACVIPHP